MTGKEIFNRMNNKEKVAIKKEFEKQSKNRVIYKIIFIFISILVLGFAIWNLVALIKSLFSGYIKLAFNLYAFIGFDIFAVIWLLFAYWRQKSLYKYIERISLNANMPVGSFTKYPTIKIQLTFLENIERNLPGYMPHIVIDNTEDYLGIRFTDNFEENNNIIIAEVELLYYDNGVDYSGLNRGTLFAIKEGATVVAKGYVI